MLHIQRVSNSEVFLIYIEFLWFRPEFLLRALVENTIKIKTGINVLVIRIDTELRTNVIKVIDENGTPALMKKDLEYKNINVTPLLRDIYLHLRDNILRLCDNTHQFYETHHLPLPILEMTQEIMFGLYSLYVSFSRHILLV